MKKIVGTGVLLLVVALMPQLALGQVNSQGYNATASMMLASAKRQTPIRLKIKIEQIPPFCPITQEKEMSEEAKRELLDIWTRMIVNIGSPDYGNAIYHDLGEYVNKGGSLTFCKSGKDGKIETLLSRAVEMQDSLLVGLLLSTDISANTIVNYKTEETILMYAIHLGDKDIIDSLVRAGADVTAKDASGRSVKDYMEMWKQDVQKILSK